MTPTEMQNLPIVATLIQFIGDVTLDVVGNDIAAEIDGQKITQASVKVLAAATLNSVISEAKHA